jgi:hypothetical protein
MARDCKETSGDGVMERSGEIAGKRPQEERSGRRTDTGTTGRFEDTTRVNFLDGKVFCLKPEVTKIAEIMEK